MSGFVGRERDDDKGSILQQHQLTFMTFLGGITFAALVLVLESKDKIKSLVVPPELAPFYFNALSLLIAAVTVNCIIGSIAMVLVAGGATPKRSDVKKFANAAFLFSASAMLIAAPVLLIPFAIYASALTGGLEAVWLIMFLLSRRRRKKR